MRGYGPAGDIKQQVERLMRHLNPFDAYFPKPPKTYPLLTPLPGEPGWDKWHKANVKRGRKQAKRLELA